MLQVHTARKKLLDANKEISSEMLRKVLLGTDEEKWYILEIFQRHYDQMQVLVGKEYAAGTLQRYRTSLDHTRLFIQWKYRKDDLEIKDLDFDFISDYSFWLKSQQNCGNNSKVKYLSNLKKIVLTCVKRGWLPRDPFYGFKLAKKEIPREVLGKDELSGLATKNISIDRLDLVRDIFLFCCYTGLAYIDVKKLTRDEIEKGIDGKEWIMTYRQKTESLTRLPLLPTALRIIDKYKEHPQCESMERYCLF